MILYDGRIGQQAFHEPRRSRRRRQQLERTLAEPQAELQHVEAFLGMTPLGHLVAPGGLELMAAQAFWVLGRKYHRHLPVLPHQPAPAGFEARTVAARDRGDARDTLDHHVAHVGQRLTDQGKAEVLAAGKGWQGMHQPVDPLGAGARLAGTASTQQKPDVGRSAEQGVLGKTRAKEPFLADQPSLPSVHILP